MFLVGQKPNEQGPARIRPPHDPILWPEPPAIRDIFLVQIKLKPIHSRVLPINNMFLHGFVLTGK